jgi:hypothetical protein
MEPKPMHPFSLRAFQKDQEHDLKHPSWVDLISTKQTNYFIDRILKFNKFCAFETECLFCSSWICGLSLKLLPLTGPANPGRT